MGEIKVTDRRMFTADGRLREEYERELAETAAEGEASASAGEERAAEPVPAPQPAAPVVAESPASAAEPKPFELPSGTAGKAPTGLIELIQILGELAAGCLGQAPLPDGRLLLDLEGARFYIDLVAALKERFGPALAPEDRRAIEAFVDQLRLQYVARKG